MLLPSHFIFIMILWFLQFIIVQFWSMNLVMAYVCNLSCFPSSDIYTPRSVLRPTSPVGIGSPLLRPRLPQQTSPPFKSSTPIAAIQHTYPKQSTLHQHTFGDFSKQSPNSNTPSYWDPNILRGMFR